MPCESQRESPTSFPVVSGFVPLSSVSDHSLIASPIAQAFGVRETGNQSPQESLKEYVSGLGQPTLLLLDNFEHLVAAAPVVAQLLTVGPKLKIVVTSQAPLHVYGEHDFLCRRSRCPTPNPFRLSKCFPLFPRSSPLWNARAL